MRNVGEFIAGFGGEPTAQLLLVARKDVYAELSGTFDPRPAGRPFIGEKTDQGRIERHRSERSYHHSSGRAVRLDRRDYADPGRIVAQNLSKGGAIDNWIDTGQRSDSMRLPFTEILASFFKIPVDESISAFIRSTAMINAVEERQAQCRTAVPEFTGTRNRPARRQNSIW